MGRAPETTRTFVGLQSRGLIAIPADVRKRHGLDEPGAQVEIVERVDGVLELHPHVPVRSDQTWFWTDRWQRMERDADSDIATGRTVLTGGPDEFLAELDS